MATIEPFGMTVSDIMDVPLRGLVLRLKVVSGSAKVAELAIGRKLRLIGPSGEHQVVRILAHPLAGGKVTQKRLDKYGEFDALIGPADAGGTTAPINFGFRAEPVPD